MEIPRHVKFLTGARSCPSPPGPMPGTLPFPPLRSRGHGATRSGPAFTAGLRSCIRHIQNAASTLGSNWRAISFPEPSAPLSRPQSAPRDTVRQETSRCSGGHRRPRYPRSVNSSARLKKNSSSGCIVFLKDLTVFHAGEERANRSMQAMPLRARMIAVEPARKWHPPGGVPGLSQSPGARLDRRSCKR